METSRAYVAPVIIRSWETKVSFSLVDFPLLVDPLCVTVVMSENAQRCLEID